MARVLDLAVSLRPCFGHATRIGVARDGVRCAREQQLLHACACPARPIAGGQAPPYLHERRRSPSRVETRDFRSEPPVFRFQSGWDTRHGTRVIRPR